MKVVELFDTLLKQFTELSYKKDILHARQEFQRYAGVIQDNVTFYIEKLDQFLSWYILDYELDRVELSPLEFYYEQNLSSMDTETLNSVLSLKYAKQRLLKIKYIKNNRLYVYDMFSSENFIVNDKEYNRLLKKGDILSARLYKEGMYYYFLKGVLNHPEESFNYIENKVKFLKYLDYGYIEAFLFRLLLMRLKAEEYSYLDIKSLYSDKPLIHF